MLGTSIQEHEVEGNRMSCFLINYTDYTLVLRNHGTGLEARLDPRGRVDGVSLMPPWGSSERRHAQYITVYLQFRGCEKNCGKFLCDWNERSEYWIYGDRVHAQNKKFLWMNMYQDQTDELSIDDAAREIEEEYGVSHGRQHRPR